MHGYMTKWLSEIIKKKTEKGVPHILAPRRCCLGYLKVCRDVRKKVVAGMESKQTYYVLHIPYSIY